MSKQLPQLQRNDWRELVAELERDAEALRRQESEPTALADLALRAVAVLWSAWTPRQIAVSCRASLMLDQPFLAGLPAAVALLETEDALAAAAGADLPELPALTWELAPEPKSRKARSESEGAVPRANDDAAPKPPTAPTAPEPPTAPTAPEPPTAPTAPEPPAEPAQDPDELPQAWLAPPETAAAPSPEPSGDQVPEGFASAGELARQVNASPMAVANWASRNLKPEDICRVGRNVFFRADAVVSTYVPCGQRPRSELGVVVEPPAGWLTTAQASAQLALSAGSLGRWRMCGKFGSEGEGWTRLGKLFYYNPDALKPAALDGWSE